MDVSAIMFLSLKTYLFEQDVAEKNFVQLSYTDAIELLLKAKKKFEFPVLIFWQFGNFPTWFSFHCFCIVVIDGGKYIYLKLLHPTHAKMFSNFDLEAGFWQLGISPEERYKTAFCIPNHHYQWTVMPLGLIIASTCFQKAMTNFETFHLWSLNLHEDIYQCSFFNLIIIANSNFLHLIGEMGMWLAEWAWALYHWRGLQWLPCDYQRLSKGMPFCLN